MVNTSSPSSSEPSLALQPSGMTKRQHALYELLSSERAYASDLALIRDIHLPLALGLTVPLSILPATPPNSSGSSSRSQSTSSDSSTSLAPPMTPEDAKTIFGNIIEIAVFTDMFTDELELALGSVVEGGQGTDAVGALFLRIAPELERSYHYYIPRHPTALQHLQNLPQTLALQNYLAYTQSVSSSLSHSWDLASFLIQPVQRLLKYPLLLTAIMDETPDDHPDKESLRVARATMQEVVRKVDQGRRRREVVKDVLASKSTKKTNNAVGVIASVGITKMSIRHSGITAATMRVSQLEGSNNEAMQVEVLQAELKQIDLFAKDFAKTMVDWGKMISKMTLAMRTWSRSLRTVMGISESDSEAFDAFLDVVERGLLPLTSDLEATINDRILKDLAHLLMSMNQPFKLVASMDEQEPYHYQLMTMPVTAKRRPPPSFLVASNNYLALRGVLAAELPTYIRLLHKGLTTLIRRLSEIQTTFWVDVRNRWVGLWEMFRAESELNVGSQETCAVWLTRWTEVDQLICVLTIAKPVQDAVANYLKEKEERGKEYATIVARQNKIELWERERQRDVKKLFRGQIGPPSAELKNHRHTSVAKAKKVGPVVIVERPEDAFSSSSDEGDYESYFADRFTNSYHGPSRQQFPPPGPIQKARELSPRELERQRRIEKPFRGQIGPPSAELKNHSVAKTKKVEPVVIAERLGDVFSSSSDDEDGGSEYEDYFADICTNSHHGPSRQQFPPPVPPKDVRWVTSTKQRDAGGSGIGRNVAVPAFMKDRNTNTNRWKAVSIMAPIEEVGEGVSFAQTHTDKPDDDSADPTDALIIGPEKKHVQTNKPLQSTELVKTRKGIGDYKTPILTSEGKHDQTDACSLLSVQSFEPQMKGLSSDMIITVGMPPEDPTENLFSADTRTPSTPSQSIRRLSLHSARSFMDASADNFSERISDYRSSSSSMFESRSGRLNFRTGNESNRVSVFSSVDGNWDRLSVVSRETFETAQEPPPELLLALGLHLDPISRQTPLPEINEPSLAGSPVPNFTGLSRNEHPRHEEESVDSKNPITDSKGHSPLYNVSLIRDVSNVRIMGSQINFTTTIVHNDDDVRVGLHTLCLRSDPTALHNSYERQVRMNQQMKAMRSWGSQLSITSSSTPGEYPLSVPSIKTRDLEDVVKDVFTWLYSISSPHSIMWLHEQECEENLRTSLIGQCLANFLGERRDLTASYFYTRRTPAGTCRSGTDGQNNPSSIIPTISYELTRRIPQIEIPIALTAAKDLWIFDLSLDEQMKKLIVDPLLAASNTVTENPCKFPQLFLIHGLEDCNDHDFQELFLCAFGKALTSLQQSIPQKLLLLGRHTAHLSECFSKPEMQGVVRHLLLPVSKDVTI